MSVMNSADGQAYFSSFTAYKCNKEKEINSSRRKSKLEIICKDNLKIVA